MRGPREWAGELRSWWGRLFGDSTAAREDAMDAEMRFHLVIGVYGVTAFTVRRRQQEFGIRMAVGAHARAITGAVVRDALRTSAAGVAIGVLGALLLTRSLGTLLFGVSPADPVVLAGSAALLALAAIIASWIPARRAARSDPAHVLHAG